MSSALLPRDRERLRGVHPDLVRVVERAREIASFIVVEGLRTRQRQAELFAAGKSKTMNSRHITGHAVDLAPWDDDGDGVPETGEIAWSRDAMAPVVAAMRQAAAALGIPLVHGHDWGWDSPHHELDRKVYP
ncbi:M15 family metallopeptidase [Roseococcus sp. SDR]|uniref:M15 family metallopeptidase n=1 Tax=Roseococcus sp. SDR TaxID=2835532 RepID=UPI001BCB0F44|nr:M15 family metallopeptidase [Roseococcus sp. SDR]MBS7790310.1 M15 family metallopeptidase [Roseococcus sp. SDR]MBV1845624.1 M15 family metallopeptidase [Roseococcus sp. SDR]